VPRAALASIPPEAARRHTTSRVTSRLQTTMITTVLVVDDNEEMRVLRASCTSRGAIA
jgi:hypothetical protein